MKKTGLVLPCRQRTQGYNKMLKLLSLILLLFIISATSYGDIYYWIDKNGVKHFSNAPASLDSESEIKLIKEKNKLTSLFPEEINDTGNFQILKVYDGDSIKVKGYNLVFMVRLVGIDSPETGGASNAGQPYSNQAKNFLLGKTSGKKVVLKSYGMGRYNRQLAEVFINNKNINLEILKKGFAEVYKGKTAKGIDINLYKEAELQARQKRLGIWSLRPSEYKSPKQWRKENPRK